MGDLCNIINYSYNQLVNISTIRSFGSISDGLEDCLVDLRWTNQDFTPFQSFTDIGQNVSASVAWLCLPIIGWYSLLGILQWIQQMKTNNYKHVQHESKLSITTTTTTDAPSTPTTETAMDETEFFNTSNTSNHIKNELISDTVKSTLGLTGVETFDIITPFIWFFSGFLSWIFLFGNDPISITQFIFIYGNRGLIILSCAQLVFITQGITLVYSHTKYYKQYVTYQQMLQNQIETRMDELGDDLEAYQIKMKLNKFPSQENIQSTLIEYLLFTYNLCVLFILLVGWIFIWDNEMLIFYTSIGAATCLMTGTIAWFWVWSPLNGLNWYQQGSGILICGFFWFVTCFLLSIPLLSSSSTNSANEVFCYTNDTYLSWWPVLPVGVLFQMLLIICLFYGILNNAVFPEPIVSSKNTDMTIEMASISDDQSDMDNVVVSHKINQSKVKRVTRVTTAAKNKLVSKNKKTRTSEKVALIVQ